MSVLYFRARTINTLRLDKRKGICLPLLRRPHRGLDLGGELPPNQRQQSSPPNFSIWNLYCQLWAGEGQVINDASPTSIRFPRSIHPKEAQLPKAAATIVDRMKRAGSKPLKENLEGKLTKSHHHNRAKRYVEKRLLRNLWRAWRTAIITAPTIKRLPHANLLQAAE